VSTLRRKTALVLLVYALPLLFSPMGRAQDSPKIAVDTQTPQRLSLVVGKSIVINSPAPVKRVSLAAPEIADPVVISPRQIYLTGKAIGTTNLTVWRDQERVGAVFDIDVSPDLSQLKAQLQAILPGENLRVSATHDALTLSGEVSSPDKLSQALAIAEAVMPKKVINLMQVAGVHQVMLEVRIAEMSRSLTRRLGFNFAVIGSSAFGLSLLNGLTSLSGVTALSNTASRALNVSPAITSVFGFQEGGVNVTGFVDALKENGLIKVLAEPTLVTVSGQEASFLAGGEFPVPVVQQINAVSVEYKPFGVGLRFIPTVFSDKKISLRVAPEVSDLDFTNAVTLNGFVIPALNVRRAATVIELGDGQSFAIAGLLNENVRETIAKFPLLGDIPILGALFRSSNFQKRETELVIIVTPHLVKPLDPRKQTLPTDLFIEPNDFEFYLLGQLEGHGKQVEGHGKVSGKLDGKFGYLVP
jgi:pilus assembly protein CpaC